MLNAYQDANSAIKYLDFLNSPNGQIQQNILWQTISLRLPHDPESKILDAGCGPGWLTTKLHKLYSNIQACDSSELFIKFAKSHNTNIPFTQAGLLESLPYPENYFDTIILNMVGPDLANLDLAIKNISVVLKPGGVLIMTVPNPKYSFPAAVWKRGFLDILLRKKPKLIFQTPPPVGQKIQREFSYQGFIPSFYYTLENYQKAARSAALTQTHMEEIRSLTDSKKFDLNYQLYRYPLLLLLEFSKLS
ncbi:MAG: class I SAM-dependent methyltransferase [Candidatus Doudnabacteria bacterium]|jgi:2-polyprenyl-3-methyl-5-hydroxy-6-metoxy-1,4-benzoquinol methylase